MKKREMESEENTSASEGEAEESNGGDDGRGGREGDTDDSASDNDNDSGSGSESESESEHEVSLPLTFVALHNHSSLSLTQTHTRTYIILYIYIYIYIYAYSALPTLIIFTSPVEARAEASWPTTPPAWARPPQWQVPRAREVHAMCECAEVPLSPPIHCSWPLLFLFLQPSFCCCCHALTETLSFSLTIHKFLLLWSIVVTYLVFFFPRVPGTGFCNCRPKPIHPSQVFFLYSISAQHGSLSWQRLKKVEC